MISKCIICGIEFETTSSRKTCSDACLRESHRRCMTKTQRDRWGAEYRSKLSEDSLALMHQYANTHDDANRQLVIGVLESLHQQYTLDPIVDGVQYDIEVPSLRMLLSIDSSVNCVAFRDVKDNIYIHKMDGYLKSKHAADNGYRCVHWYDWDDIFKLPTLLSDPVSISARNCIVREVEIAESNMFMNMYHLQRSRRGTKLALGLFYHDELVEVMTFGYPWFNKHYEWEIYRFCSDPMYRVVGGVSKLLQSFIRIMDPKSIITYCDVSKFNGDVYSKIGMKFRSFTKPSIIWSRGTEQLSTNVLTRFRYDGLFGTQYGKDANNTELMILNGWLPVYNCGQYTYEWQKTTPCI